MWRVTGSIADQDNQLLRNVLAVKPIEVIKVRETGSSRPVRKVVLHNVSHYIVAFESHRTDQLLAVEEAILKEVFYLVFKQFEPDVVLTYGGFSSNYLAGLYTLSRGRLAVLYASSANYDDPSQFIHVNRVVTLSNALSEKLDGVTTLPKLILSSLVRRSDVVCRNRSGEFITFINPVPEKGLSLVIALAAECRKRGRAYKFLIVESRGNRETLAASGVDLSAQTNISFANNTADIRLVYEKTALLLVPSLCFEAAGRLLIEANANRIPALAHDVGGVAETLDGAGYLFNPPEEMLQNWSAPVPPDYVAEWLAVLDRLHNDPTEMSDAVRRAEEADARYSLSGYAQRFVEFVSTSGE